MKSVVIIFLVANRDLCTVQEDMVTQISSLTEKLADLESRLSQEQVSRSTEKVMVVLL